MNSSTRVKALSAGLLLAACGPAAAAGYASSAAAIGYESGGIGITERAAMRREAGRYSLWLTTAATHSGAYLADVDVRITRPGNDRTALLETRTDGPWLLVDLPPGRYEVEAVIPNPSGHEVFIKRQTVDVPEHGVRQVVMYFDIDADVLPVAGSDRR